MTTDVTLMSSMRDGIRHSTSAITDPSLYAGKTTTIFPVAVTIWLSPDRKMLTPRRSPNLGTPPQKSYDVLRRARLNGTARCACHGCNVRCAQDLWHLCKRTTVGFGAVHIERSARNMTGFESIVQSLFI